MNLLVAWPAERDAHVGFAALLLGQQVVQRNEPARNRSLAQLASI
jgi:hypothetical protein